MYEYVFIYLCICLRDTPDNTATTTTITTNTNPNTNQTDPIDTTDTTESIPLLAALQADEIADGEGVINDWQRCGRAIDRICRILIPLIFIIFVFKKFQAVHEL